MYRRCLNILFTKNLTLENFPGGIPGREDEPFSVEDIFEQSKTAVGGYGTVFLFAQYGCNANLNMEAEIISFIGIAGSFWI